MTQYHGLKLLHGNIEGGNGIFSLGTKDVEIIEL